MKNLYFITVSIKIYSNSVSMETLFESNFASFEALFSERLVFKDGSICDFVRK